MNSFLLGAIVLQCFIFYFSQTTAESFDSCCSFPCQNGGVCMTEERGYECDCTNTGYYGTDCDKPHFSTKIKKWLKPSKDSLHYFLTHFTLLWKIINKATFIRKLLMKKLLTVRTGLVDDPIRYNGFGEYVTWESYANSSVYVRSLPAVPKNCPTPMGVKGKKVLPDADMLVEKFFVRQSFQPCPRRTSIIFPLFAQHFTHQFFKTDFKKGFPFQWGSHSVDLSQVYGDTHERQQMLRSHVDGKMKYSILNGEMFPPLVSDANVSMEAADRVADNYLFAIGHQGFSMQPVLLYFATIWLREHNRVCDVLKKEQPTWDDERLFQTARLILIGQTLKIVIEDYVQHLSGYNFNLVFDPELLHDTGFAYNNKIHMEFQLLYRWHALMPDFLTVNNQSHSIRSLIFNPQPFVEAGMATWTREATNQFAAKAAGGKTQGQATLNVARHAIIDGRRLRLQSFNQYRKRFDLKPYTSFTEFTEDETMAKELEEVYGDIDAVEYFIGIMLEKRRAPLMFGQSLTEIGSPYSLKGVYGNPISSPGWWKASTFGGETGFNIIKTANLQDLICRNVKGCPHVSFEVPQDVTYEPDERSHSHNDNSSHILMNISRGNPTSSLLEEVGSSKNRLKIEL